MKKDNNFNIKLLLDKLRKKKDKPDGEEEQNDFLGKIGSFFDPEPQKERVLSQEDFKGAGDVYYATISAFYKIAERLLWVILAVFMVFSIATNYKEITYNNFFYLLRDFSAVADSDTSGYQILSYDSDDRQKFALYRGGLVSASPSSISVFTAGGRRTLKSNNDYYSPNVLCCDKYVLVYDTAGASFSVYNSFSKIYNETLDGPITDACFDEKGAFALAIRKNDTETAVYLYNDNIKQRGVLRDSRFVFDINLNEDASKLVALYYQAGSGVGETAVCVYDVKSSESAKKLKEIKLEGEFPLECAFLDNGSLAVVTDRSVRIYDKNFGETEVDEFGENKITAFSVCEDGVAVALSEGIEKRVAVFDKKGKKQYDGYLEENISAIGMADDSVFLRTVSGVIRLDTKEDEKEFLPCEEGKMLIYDADTAIVCGDAKAEYLVFERH